MATTVVINGLNYSIPAVGDNNWGQNVTDALVALTTAASASAGFLNRVSVASTPITVVSGRTYLVDTTVARTLNLPAPANNAYLIVKDVTGTSKTNNITVHRFAAEKINGTAADFVCSNNSAHWLFVSDGTDWFLLKDPDITPYAQLNLTNSVVNADIASAAAIAYSKLNLAASVVNTDIGASAAIAYSKLALAGSVVNSDIGNAAGIAYSKLNLTGSVVNADISASAAIAVSKIAALNTNVAVATDGSGNLITSTVTTTLTELNYVHNVTSAIQTQLNAKQATLTAGQLPATATNDNASAGNVGQYVSSQIANTVFGGTTTQYVDFTSISLTAGDWDVSVIFAFIINASTTTFTAGGISLTAGNTASGLVTGDNFIQSVPPTSTTSPGGSVPTYRLSLASTTPVYMKVYAEFSAGTPKVYGRISARRIR